MFPQITLPMAMPLSAKATPSVPLPEPAKLSPPLPQHSWLSWADTAPSEFVLRELSHLKILFKKKTNQQTNQFPCLVQHVLPTSSASNKGTWHWKLLVKVGSLAEDLPAGVATERKPVVSQKAALTVGSFHGQKVSG